MENCFPLLLIFTQTLQVLIQVIARVHLSLLDGARVGDELHETNISCASKNLVWGELAVNSFVFKQHVHHSNELQAKLILPQVVTLLKNYTPVLLCLRSIFLALEHEQHGLNSRCEN